jgi:DNA-binding Lrp family transcriptional regulator
MTAPDFLPAPPIRAMSRLLAEMQTSILTHALPLFDTRVDRFMIYALLMRRTLDGDRPTPVLAIAESLGMPFETTRRHVAALMDAGLSRRERAGVLATPVTEGGPIHALMVLTHDCLVRFIHDMQAIDALPDYTASPRRYDWHSGIRAAADLMLAVANTNQRVHHDRLDLVLFGTILCATQRPVTEHADVARRYRTIAEVPADDLVRPLRARRVAAVLGLADATVRRRLERLVLGPVRIVPAGLAVSEGWLASAEAVETSVASYANLRRLLGTLAAQGFPFADPCSAYLAGRPAAVCFD